MAAGDTLQGRRVEGFGDLERPGDYSFASGILWAVLPTGSHARLPSQNHGQQGEAEWTIREEPDGTVTVDPSIRQHPINAAGIPGWHGYLERGTWREV
jgi:hypothetical protein